MQVMVPVHCCCNPETRLGWLPLEQSRLYPHRLRFVVQPTLEELTRRRDGSEPPMGSAFGQLETEVCELWRLTDERDPDGARIPERFMALKSGDVPLEVWKRVRGFQADTVRELVRHG